MSARLIGRHLIESAPRRPRGAGSLFLSSVVHSGLIALSIASNLGARGARSEPEHVVVVHLSAFRERTATQATPAAAATPPPKRSGFQVLVPPMEIPPLIPLARVVASTRAEDFTGRGVLGGLLPDIRVASLSQSAFGSFGEPIDGAIADQAPYLLPGQMGPAYPDSLRDYALDGLVVARFVVDTLGRVEAPSLTLVESTHPLFASSVRVALIRLRFLPAHFSGQRVRVRIEQRFEFHLASR